MGHFLCNLYSTLIHTDQISQSVDIVCIKTGNCTTAPLFFTFSTWETHMKLSQSFGEASTMMIVAITSSGLHAWYVR